MHTIPDISSHRLSDFRLWNLSLAILVSQNTVNKGVVQPQNFANSHETKCDVEKSNSNAAIVQLRVIVTWFRLFLPK